MDATTEGRVSGARDESPMATASLWLEHSAYEYYSKASRGRRLLMDNRVVAAPAPPPAASPPPSRDSPATASAFQTLDPTVVIILVVLLFALICAAFLNSIMRCLLRRARGRRAAGGRGGGGGSQSSAPGIDPKILASLPVLTFTGDKSLCKDAVADCTICLSEFAQSEKLRLLPKCSHVFHLDCIDMWLQSHVSCPVCRDGVTDDDLVSVPLDADDQHVPVRGGLIPLNSMPIRHDQPSMTAAPGAASERETPDVRVELLMDSAGRSSSAGSMDVLQQPQLQSQQGNTSSRGSLRSTLSSMFAADHFFSGRWQTASSSSGAAPAPPATGRLPLRRLLQRPPG